MASDKACCKVETGLLPKPLYLIAGPPPSHAAGTSQRVADIIRTLADHSNARFALAGERLHTTQVARPMGLTESELAALKRDGFVGPFDLEKPVDCNAVETDARRLRFIGEWYKGAHMFKGAAFDASTDHAITTRLQSALGDDLLMWSSELMLKPPGQPHRWHSDIEAVSWNTLNIWMALRNVTEDSTLRLVPGSHLWDVMPQNLPDLDVQSEAAVLAAARRYDPNAVIARIPMKAGQFAIFDGRAWHGTENPTGRVRTALLCQYSPPSETIRQPLSYGLPARWAEKLPACVLVAGQARNSPSRIDKARVPSFSQHTKARIRTLAGAVRRLPSLIPGIAK